MPPTLIRSCVHRMISATICTFTWELTVINMVVRILLTTFSAHFTSSTIILMLAIFLAFVTSQWVGYVLLDPLHCIVNFYFFGYFGGVKLHYICICLYCFPFFFSWQSFYFSPTLLFLPLFLFLRWCIRRVLYFSQPPYSRSGICEGMFWHWYCETLSFYLD